MKAQRAQKEPEGPETYFTGKRSDDMLRTPFGAFLSIFLYTALMSLTAAQEFPAPVGHRQPTAATVPIDDSVRGLGPSDVEPPRQFKAPNAWYNDTKVPNICWNCNE